METIRNARIVVHLESGRVSLKAPDLSPVIKAREREAVAAERLTTAVQQAHAAQDAATAAAIQGFQRAEASQISMLKSVQKIGQGFFMLSRSAVLLGSSSDESFTQLVNGLAKVHGAFDLLKGTTAIITGMTAAIAKAGGVVRALALAFAPLTLAIGAVVVAGAILLRVIDSLYESDGERLERLKAITEAYQKQAQVYAGVRGREESLAGDRRELMDPKEKIEDLRQRASIAEKLAAEWAKRRSGSVGGDKALKESETAELQRAIDYVQQRVTLARQLADTEKDVIDNQLKQIEQQERLVEQAQKQVDVERRKREEFQAQFGAMSELERQSLRQVADKVRAGDKLNSMELEFLATKGGVQGQNIARDINATAGREAGADDVFKGIKSAGDGLESAEKDLDRVTKALEEMVKKFSGVGDVTEAKQKLEKAKEELDTQYEQFLAAQKDWLADLTKNLEGANAQLKAIDEAMANGAP